MVNVRLTRAGVGMEMGAGRAVLPPTRSHWALATSWSGRPASPMDSPPRHGGARPRSRSALTAPRRPRMMIPKVRVLRSFASARSATSAVHQAQATDDIRENEVSGPHHARAHALLCRCGLCIAMACGSRVSLHDGTLRWARSSSVGVGGIPYLPIAVSIALKRARPS